MPCAHCKCAYNSNAYVNALSHAGVVVEGDATVEAADQCEASLAPGVYTGAVKLAAREPAMA